MIKHTEESQNQHISFIAKSIHIENTGDSYLLIFYNLSEYLLLQRTYEFDTQDHIIGMDTYYIEYSDQSKSCYGGIEDITIDKDKLNIMFNEIAAKKLKTTKQLSIEIKINDETYQELTKQINNILKKGML